MIKLLKNKKYLRYLISNVIDRLGDSIDTIVLSFIMYEVTGSASMMALIIGVNYLPTIFLQPIAGVIVEKMKKKPLIVIGSYVRAILLLILLITYISGVLSVVLLFIIVLLESSVECFSRPASTPFYLSIIGKDDIEKANSLSQSSTQITTLVGYALSGIIVMLFSRSGAIVFDIISFVIAGSLIWTIKYEEDIDNQEKLNIKGIYKGLFEGFTYIKEYSYIFVLMLMACLLNFVFVPLNSLLPAYVIETLNGNETTLSIIEIGLVLGLATGALLSPKIHLKFNKLFELVLLISAVAYYFMFAISYYSSSKSVYIVAMLMFCLTLFIGVINVKVFSLLLSSTSKEYLARISALISSMVICMQPLGSIIASIIIKLTDVNVTFLIFGIAIIAVLVLMLFNNKISSSLKSIPDIK